MKLISFHPTKGRRTSELEGELCNYYHAIDPKGGMLCTLKIYKTQNNGDDIYEAWFWGLVPYAYRDVNYKPSVSEWNGDINGYGLRSDEHGDGTPCLHAAIEAILSAGFYVEGLVGYTADLFIEDVIKAVYPECDMIIRNDLGFGGRAVTKYNIRPSAYLYNELSDYAKMQAADSLCRYPDLIWFTEEGARV